MEENKRKIYQPARVRIVLCPRKDVITTSGEKSSNELVPDFMKK